MASRLIRSELKSPILFLLRNPASKTSPPLAQSIQNLLVPPQNPQSDAREVSKRGFLQPELGLNNPQLSMALKSISHGGYRTEAGKGRPSLDDVRDDADDSAIGSDFSDFDSDYDDVNDEDLSDLGDDFDSE